MTQSMTQWILPFGIMTVLVLTNAVLSFFALFRGRFAFKAATELHEEACRLSEAKVAALQFKLDALAAEVASSAEQATTAPAASVKPAMNLNKRSHALRLHRRGDPPDIGADPRIAGGAGREAVSFEIGQRTVSKRADPDPGGDGIKRDLLVTRAKGRATAGSEASRALRRYAFGQLSLIQRARFSSVTSPAASARIMAAASASGTTKSTSLTPRNV